MRKIFRFTLICLLLFGILASGYAFEATEKFALGGSLNVWPTGGGSLLLPGLSGTYGFTPNVQGEVAVDFHSSTGSFWGQHTVLSIIPIWLSGKYVFQPKRQLNPFISGGLFWVTGNVYSTEKTFRYHGLSRAGLHLGGGADYFIRDDVSINGELRLPVGAPGFDGIRLNLGAKYYFDLKKK